jgi:Flp pilus assembly protein TadG
MNEKMRLFLTRLYREERGQALPLIAFAMVMLLGMAGFVIDVGNVYFTYHKLQSSTDAAALAGSQYMPNTTAATVATAYSGVSGDANAAGNMPGVTMVSGYPQYKCLTSVNYPCLAPAGGNAIVVKQQITVPMHFAQVLGVKPITLTATSTASMRGQVNGSYNVAIVVDTTASMNDTDTDSTCNTTRIACALNGVQILLGELSPCPPTQSTCAMTSGQATNPVDQVSLFAFPNVTATTAVNDTNCSGTNPTAEPYTFPSTTASSYTDGTITTTTGSGKHQTTTTTSVTYQILGYSSNYRSSDTASALTSTAAVVQAAGGGASNCPGMQAPGGEGTYYAGVIYAAQASLAAAQTANPQSKNVMIIISDGNAGTTDSGAMPGASTTTGTYPSTIDQCHQAVTAAQAATTAGTTVYTVAYGAESSGCGTDSPSITPCQVMQQMASNSATFFSDYTAAGGGACVAAAEPMAALADIFKAIGGDLTLARLIPNNSQ